MRTRLVLPVGLLVAVTACSGGGSGSKPAALDATGTPSASPSASSSASSSAEPSASAGATTAAPAASPAATRGTATSPRAATTAPRTGATTAAPQGAAPGSYALDAKGTITLGSPGTPQDASGTSTLTVSPVSAGTQHSTLHSDHGDTAQDVVFRADGTYAAGLKISSPAFTAEFRPSPPVLLVGNPARVGATWSWKAVSTDGGTTATATNKVVRTETLTIGGTQVATTVLQTHLVLTGKADYTADITSWFAPAYRLVVKDHTVGKGSYNGFPFSMDITSTLRSVRPS